MPTSVVTHFPNPSAIVTQRNTTSIYTMASGKFGEFMVLTAADFKINGVVGYAPSGSLQLVSSTIKILAGTTLQHPVASVASTTIISEFDI